MGIRALLVIQEEWSTQRCPPPNLSICNVMHCYLCWCSLKQAILGLTRYKPDYVGLTLVWPRR